MKAQPLFRLLLASVAVAAASAAAHAQSSGDTQSITRAQVQKELAQLEAAGYDPHRDSSNYPADIQAAEARVAAMNQSATKEAR